MKEKTMFRPNTKHDERDVSGVIAECIAYRRPGHQSSRDIATPWAEYIVCIHDTVEALRALGLPSGIHLGIAATLTYKYSETRKQEKRCYSLSMITGSINSTFRSLSCSV